MLSAPLAPGAAPALRSSHPPLSPLCEHRSSRSAQTLVGFLSADFAFARSAVPRSPETPHRWRGAGRARPPPAEPTPRAQVPGGRGSGAAAVRSRPSRPALHVLRPCAPACCAGRVPRPLLPRRAPEPQHDAGRRGGRGGERRRGGRGRGDRVGLRAGSACGIGAWGAAAAFPARENRPWLRCVGGARPLRRGWQRSGGRGAVPLCRAPSEPRRGLRAGLERLWRGG